MNGFLPYPSGAELTPSLICLLASIEGLLAFEYLQPLERNLVLDI